jgi:SUMO ligase MMS21 Smc5/6 complex component
LINYSCDYYTQISAHCSHHVEEAAIVDYLSKKGGSAKCPVAGCGKMWTKASYSLDEDFVYSMQIHFRNAASASAMSSNDVNTINVDEDDDGYTAV